jgi:O-antigen/teichoic acid export membrane protein
MTIVAGDQFIASGRILAILCLAIMGVYIGAIFGHLAVAINRQKETIWVYLSSAVLTLIGYLIFIPRYGMYGAAWMSVFSELFVGVCLWLTIRRFVSDNLQLKTVGKILMATLAMSLILWLSAPLHILIRIICGIVIYSSVLIATGGISQSTIREIFSSSKNAS